MIGLEGKLMVEWLRDKCIYLGTDIPLKRRRSSGRTHNWDLRLVYVR